MDIIYSNKLLPFVIGAGKKFSIEHLKTTFSNNSSYQKEKLHYCYFSIVR